MSYRTVLKDHDFVFLWLSQILFQTAYNLCSYALTIRVFQLTRSNFLVGVLMFFFFLPSFLFSLPAGVVTDLFNRRKILILTKILWAAFVLALAFLGTSFVPIIVISLVIQAIDEFSIPAEKALLPQIVSKDCLLSANSLFTFSLYISLFLGFGLAGPLMRFVGYSFPLFLAAGLSVLAAVSTLLISPRESQFSVDRRLKEEGLFRVFADELRLGGRELLQAKSILKIILLMIFFRGVVSTLAALSPGFMEEGLGIHSEDASFVLALPLGIGLTLGTLLTGIFGRFKKKSALTLWGIFLSGAALLGMGAGPFVRRLFYQHASDGVRAVRYFEYIPTLSSFVMLFALVAGFGGALIYVALQSSFQETTPNRLLGRAQALLNMISYAVNLLPTLFLAGLADLVGVTTVLVFSAMVVLGAGIYVWRSKLLSRLGV